MTREEIKKVIIEAAIAFAELLFEKGLQLGMKQERVLWELSKSSQEIGYE